MAKWRSVVQLTGKRKEREISHQPGSNPRPALYCGLSCTALAAGFDYVHLCTWHRVELRWLDRHSHTVRAPVMPRVASL